MFSTFYMKTIQKDLHKFDSIIQSNYIVIVYSRNLVDIRIWLRVSGYGSCIWSVDKSWRVVVTEDIYKHGN